MIVVVSLIEGFNSYVDEKIANIGTNAFAVSKYAIDDFSSVEALNAARRRNKDVTLDDAAALRARGGAIQEVGAKEDAAGDVKFGATNLFRIHISATTPNVAEIERIEAGEGRYFTKVEEQPSQRDFIGVTSRQLSQSNPSSTIRTRAGFRSSVVRLGLGLLPPACTWPALSLSAAYARVDRSTKRYLDIRKRIRMG